MGGVDAKIQSESAGFTIRWFDFADSIYMGVLAMILSFIIVPVVSLFTNKPENVDEIFKCYSHKVIVTSDVALTEDLNKEEPTEVESKEENEEVKNDDYEPLVEATNESVVIHVNNE
jgi:hypothetical protein